MRLVVKYLLPCSAMFYMPFINSVEFIFATKEMSYESSRCKGVVLPQKERSRCQRELPCNGKVECRQVSTNFRITRSEWDSKLEDLIIKDDDSSRANYLQYVQNHIEYDKKCFKRIVKKLTISDSPFTVDTIVDEFHKQSFEITLFSYMEKMITKLWRQGQHRTSETYQATLNSFRKFREGVDVCFDDIDSEMLISYEYH